MAMGNHKNERTTDERGSEIATEYVTLGVSEVRLHRISDTRRRLAALLDEVPRDASGVSPELRPGNRNPICLEVFNWK